VIVNASQITADSDASVIWETILQEAVRHRVSDIHVLAQQGRHELHLRVDGDLRLQGEMPSDLARRLISHVKAAAEMDVAETRRPLDGHIRQQVQGRGIDMRVCTLASQHGQDMVVRVFDREVSLLDLEELGLLREQLGVIEDLLARPTGLVLVTGPTASGKTTTLYAMLRRLAGGTRKIMTIEDPIEYDLAGVNQTQVNPRIGVTFAVMVAALLRQDPDVIMVGEIRDEETARTAVRAANTGHLVLATTHAVRAARALETMLSLGVHPYFLAASLRATVAQVLVKRVCEQCKTELPETADIVLDDAVRRRLGEGAQPRLYLGQGCEACDGTGYRGRTALFEVFAASDHVRSLVLQRRPVLEIERAYQEEGVLRLEETAKLAAVRGVTTMEEIVRVLPSV